MGSHMFAKEDINVWEFLETTNFNSTENLNLLSGMLLQNKDMLMGSLRENAYGWDYEEDLDFFNMKEKENDDEDECFNAAYQEERSFNEYITKI